MKPTRIPRSVTSGLSVRRMSSRFVTKERMQAKAEAEKIVARAEKRAEEISRRAGRELARAREEGLQQGRLAGERELAERIARVEVFRNVAAERHLPGLIDLAGQMAGRILRRELELQPESIRRICREVIRENRPGRALTILVNPRDLTTLCEDGHPLTSDPEIHIELEADGGIEPGGCIVRSELGEVDARLSVQLQELSRALCEGGHE